jgi:signal transduction histidine kinase
MIHPRAARAVCLAGAFGIAYIVLDMLSGPEARYQSIAPVWHPAAGLALYSVLRSGVLALPVLAATMLLAAAITPALPAHPALSLFIGVLPVPMYLAVGTLMRRYLAGSAYFASHRGLLLWAGFVTLGSLFSAALYALMLLGPGATGSAAWFDLLTRFTIAETAGMLVIVPALHCLFDGALRADCLERLASWETAACTALIALVLAIGLQRPAAESLVFYLLILPLAWAAARHGMAGAVTAAIVLEAGVTIAALRPIAYPAQVPNVQMLVLTLTLSGFLIGIAVDVARQASEELRHSLRLAAAGEMAGALAHELNQPLTALSAYGSACERLMARGGSEALLQKTIRSMVAESQRASDVLRRLRDFFRTGSTALEPLALADVVAGAAASFAGQAGEQGIAIDVGAMPDATLLADRVQLEVVLRNLLSNAIQALAQMPEGAARRIAIDAGLDGAAVWITIADNGPGIADKIRSRLFEPFISLKSSGLGLGLAISRSIVETHGGTLTAEPGRHAVFRITLPAQGAAGKGSSHEE